MNGTLSMSAIRHRRWAPGKVLLGVVVVLVFTALASAVILSISTPLIDRRRPAQGGNRIRTTALIEDGAWINLGLLGALACHGSPLLSGDDRPQSFRDP